MLLAEYCVVVGAKLWLAHLCGLAYLYLASFCCCILSKGVQLAGCSLALFVTVVSLLLVHSIEIQVSPW